MYSRNFYRTQKRILVYSSQCRSALFFPFLSWPARKAPVPSLAGAFHPHHRTALSPNERTRKRPHNSDVPYLATAMPTREARPEFHRIAESVNSRSILSNGGSS